MTAVEVGPEPLGAVEPEAVEARPDALPTLCPYLATPDGNWRSATPAREHRCMAVWPPVQLAPDKQRRLCLVDAHVGCATYGAARAAHSDAAERHTSHARPIARMTPVILDQGRFDLRIPALRADRALGQVVLVGLLGIALVVILVTRPATDQGVTGPIGAVSSVAPSAGSSGPSAAAASSSPVATRAPASAEPPTASAPPPSIAAGSPSPTAGATTSGETYRVKRGDTLIAIAGRFGTTAKVLMELNGIVDPSKLRIGQILKLP